MKKDFIKRTIVRKKFEWGKSLYKNYTNIHKISKAKYMMSFWPEFYVESAQNNKTKQLCLLIENVDFRPIENNRFFYSIDCLKTCELQNHILDNYSVDYALIVNGSFQDLLEIIKEHPDEKFYSDEKVVIESLKNYIYRCRKNFGISAQYSRALDECDSLFERPSEHFREALQRILFFNQFLWQTRHKHNGFGRLDLLLYDLYRKDIESGEITEAEASDILKDFFRVLHENCWFKSTMLLGDTGQIIILGGIGEDGKYRFNELTYLFIKISMELKLPDPKVLLRCSSKMPDDLLTLALQCISTGIGAPFLSNDDEVIHRLESFGYSHSDSCNYATSACWEPLIINHSCDQNNIYSINYATPFVEMLENADLAKIDSEAEFLKNYRKYLETYLDRILTNLSKLVFEEDPLLSLLSESAFRKKRDIVRGGADYSNLGVTSVGMATVVNSIINVESLVFNEKRYTLDELNAIRKENYKGNEALITTLKNIRPHFGNDDIKVVKLTSAIQEMTNSIFDKYHTYYGGKFKFGLSSPQYFNEAKNTLATLDGRRNGEPFAVHISSSEPLPVTELISFATKLDYSDHRINGNVVDFIVSPTDLKKNIDKYRTIIKSAFGHGLYQLQMNVVDSKTLIEAKAHPEKFPNLIVRVWGFSAYFKDLPEEYKIILIERALASEKVT